MQVVEAAVQSLSQRGDLRAQLSLREVGEHIGIGCAGYQRIEYRPSVSATDSASPQCGRRSVRSSQPSATEAPRQPSLRRMISSVTQPS
jgi:hypothetical protein